MRRRIYRRTSLSLLPGPLWKGKLQVLGNIGSGHHRLYVSKKEGGRGHASIVECVDVSTDGLHCYYSQVHFERENYKYLEILEADTTKQAKMKKLIRREYLIRTRKFLEIKLCSRYLIKGINIWAALPAIYPRPFLKWTREELWQMNQRKLMTTHKDYIFERWHRQTIRIKKRRRKRTSQNCGMRRRINRRTQGQH